MWRAFVVTFVVGLGLGAALGVLGPDLARPYVPEMLRGAAEVVEGAVTRKQREGDRLLLTVITARGAVLANFTKKINEVDLLVEQGDAVTLRMRRFEPFVDDPEIRQVTKQERTPSAPSPPPPGAIRPAPAPPSPPASGETGGPGTR
jgi:hypothetical protein